VRREGSLCEELSKGGDGGGDEDGFVSELALLLAHSSGCSGSCLVHVLSAHRR
jgi:hypothetical protein